MTKRERKRIAQRIANLELTIQNSTDKDEKQQAQDEIMRICGQFNSLDDFTAVDELVQDLLQDNS